MKTDHNWNVLRYMAWRSRRNLLTNAEDYANFMEGRANLSDARKIVQRYVKNRWAKPMNGKYIVTKKGYEVLQQREAEVREREKEYRTESARVGGLKFQQNRLKQAQG